MMDAPFVFGKIAGGDNFIDRTEDTKLLSANFRALTNTILISPRRWGKSSLVCKAAADAMEKDKNLRVVLVDIFNVRSEEEFYSKLATEVIRQTASTMDNVLVTIKKYASAIVSGISFGDATASYSVQFKINEPMKSSDEILDLPEKIASDKGIKIVLCVDEFQQIGAFDDPRSFQANLRSKWQLHKNVSYCLYGSRRHMMMEVFGKVSMPFYKFGDLRFLKKIDRTYWLEYIPRQFSKTGKTIDSQSCERLVCLADNNPYYVQQLSQTAWMLTEHHCSLPLVEEAFDSVLSQMGELNRALTQTLTISQQNLLHAMVSGEKELSSKRVLDTYDLKSSTNVSRARKALVEKDILDDFGKEYTFEDPLYECWLRTVWFRR